MKSSLSLRLQPAVGRRGSFGSAACIALLALTAAGCAPAEGKPEEAESVSVSPFSDPEDPTPKVPEYTVRDGLELNTHEEQLAEEAVVFFEEYMAAANRAYRDGGVYWDKFNEMTSGDLLEVQKESRKRFNEENRVAKNDLVASDFVVGDIESTLPKAFVTACMHYSTWETTSSTGERASKQDFDSVSGFFLEKDEDDWHVVEVTNVDRKCG